MKTTADVAFPLLKKIVVYCFKFRLVFNVYVNIFSVLEFHVRELKLCLKLKQLFIDRNTVIKVLEIGALFNV